MNKVCLRHDKSDLKSYLAKGGYQVWKDLLKGKIKPDFVLSEIKQSGLKGRGGAGFLTGLKWGFMNRDDGHDKYLICNSDEGEPGTSKDRWILKNPHQMIEGMAICAYVIGSNTAYNYIRGEYLEEFKQCEIAVKEVLQAGLLGKNIQGSGYDLIIHNLLGAGSYIVGEETAMMEAIEGKRAMPRNKPPFPAQQGLWGKGTTINNTETLASVPMIMEKGSQWFKSLGVYNAGGTKIFSVSGHVRKPEVFECSMGIPLLELIAMCGGVRFDRKIKAVIPGGTSMKVIPASRLDGLTMDYDSVEKAGSCLGSGGVIIMDETTCMVRVLTQMMRFYHHESCGQCSPCREGSGWIYRLLEQIVSGEGTVEMIGSIRDIASKIEGRTICAFGEAMSWPVTSFIDHFYEEFVFYAREGKSMVENNDQAFSWDLSMRREEL